MFLTNKVPDQIGRTNRRPSWLARLTIDQPLEPGQLDALKIREVADIPLAVVAEDFGCFELELGDQLFAQVRHRADSPGISNDDRPARDGIFFCFCRREHSDRPARDRDVVDVKVVIGLRGPGPAVVKVQPHSFNLEAVHVAHPRIGLFKGQPAIDPAAQNTVY